ncbi:UDP-N-acetylmuramoyl-tripeptide--D-alanyl-D-alanine ligase, partial [Salmonella enterica subsp. enterica serovar Infantis]
LLRTGKISQAISHASGDGDHFADKASLIARLHAMLQEQPMMTILVKGSRIAEMEYVIHALQEKASS